MQNVKVSVRNASHGRHMFSRTKTENTEQYDDCRSQWPRGLRRRSTAARLLRSWVRIPLGAWMFVYCDCCVLSGRGLCVGPISRPEVFYRVSGYDREASPMRRPRPTRALEP